MTPEHVSPQCTDTATKTAPHIGQFLLMRRTYVADSSGFILYINQSTHMNGCSVKLSGQCRRECFSVIILQAPPLPPRLSFLSSRLR